MDNLSETERFSENFNHGEPSNSNKTRSYSTPEKWNVLRSVFEISVDNFSPSELVSELRTPSPTLYIELKKHLKDPEWAKEFVKENGVESLLETLKSVQGRTVEEVQLKVECGQCLRLVMDSRVGLDYIMENADYTQKLATALDTDDTPVKKQVFELLSALCVYRSDGYTRALETLEYYKKLKKCKYRFQLVVEELKCSEVAEYTTALVAFVNCLIISPASLNDRIRIRNEFLGLKILEVLNRFRKQIKDSSCPDLAVQLDVFDEQRSTDEGQFSGPDGVDLSSHMDVFFAILRQVTETSLEIPFLSILQHLLRTDLNQPLSEVVWETAETLVHRATLLESKQESDRLLRASNLGGLMRCHCSCHYKQTEKIGDDCDTTPRKSRPNQLSFSSDGNRTPCLLLSPNQHYSSAIYSENCSSPLFSCNTNDTSRTGCKSPLTKQNLGLAFNKSLQSNTDIQQVPSIPHVVNSDTELPFNNSNLNSSCLSNNSKISSDNYSIKCNNADSTLNSSDTSKDTNSSAFTNSVINGDKIFTNKSLSDVHSPQKTVSTNIPPPPTLIQQTNGNIPVPPPMPLSLSGNAIPPPPPPPLNISLQAKTFPSNLRLPQQNTPKPKSKMKSLNWSKIPITKVIGKDNLWSRVAKDHSGSPNDLDFEAMEQLFCLQPTSTNGNAFLKIGESPDGFDRKKKETQEINLLEGKRSLKINIFLKQFRSSNHQAIVRILQEGTHEDLGAERLRGLLKILPEPDEIEMLKNFDGDSSKLGNAEKFLLQLLQIPNYKLRIESMLLKEEFMANQEFLENSIETVRCAAQDLEECKKLHEVLYMVLVAGNFLNAGGYAGDAAGFKMLSLLKLADIRANKPSITLIHYVAEQVLKKRSDLLGFLEEVQNLEEASKISMETLKTDVISFSQRVSNVSSQVAEAEEQIKSQMMDFLQFAENKVAILRNEIEDLENVRQRLGEFLCEDVASFMMEECFKTFYNFCMRFKSALQENERRQKQEKLAEIRRKQREQQIAMKRRSLELPDSKTNIDADQILDELLGDIRNGFTERRLGDIYRRSKSYFNPEDTTSRLNRFDDNTRRSQNALKRHSDPAMLEKGRGNRKAGFLDESSEEIIGFLKNQNAIESEEKRILGNADEGLERGSFRRSGRRKRLDILNSDTNGRERSNTSPPPSMLKPTVESLELEDQSKPNLRTKINDWMTQNEKEQKREDELHFKLLEKRKKRQQNNGQPLTENRLNEPRQSSLNEANKDELPLSKEDDHSQNSNKDLQLTKSAQQRRSESFTQKIIELLDAASDSKPFTKTRLYHSTREKKIEADGVESSEQKSKDDSDLCKANTNLNSVNNKANEGMQNIDLTLAPIEESKTPPNNFNNNFDRFAITRKTQRRLKLREMRIEAESAMKSKIEDTKTDAISHKGIDSNISVKNDENLAKKIGPNFEVTAKTAIDSNQGKTAQVLIDPENVPEAFTNKNKQITNLTNDQNEVTVLPENPSTVTTDSVPNSESTFINRPRNTSLRSRQARLVRRINSLSTPVTSPTSNENKLIEEIKNEALENNLPLNCNDNNDQEIPSLHTKAIPLKEESFKEAQEKEPLKQTTFNNESDRKQTTTKNKSSPKSNHKMNGNILSKVTVNTETKSEVIIPKKNKANIKNLQTTVPKSRLNAQKPSTNIPSVIKTSQNVKLHQTIQTQHMNGKNVSPKNDDKSKAGVLSAKDGTRKTTPTTATKSKGSERDLKTRISANGKVNGESSPASSVSSICSLSTNVNLQNGKLVNGKNIQPIKKITINHNGSVKFSKSNNISNPKVTKLSTAPLSNNNSNINCRNKDTLTNKKERNGNITHKRAFV